jgi:hypothetical protein
MHRRFGGTYCVQLRNRRVSQASGKNTRRHIPGSSTMHSGHYENLKCKVSKPLKREVFNYICLSYHRKRNTLRYEQTIWNSHFSRNNSRYRLGYGLDGSGTEVTFPAGETYFSLLHSFLISSVFRIQCLVYLMTLSVSRTIYSCVGDISLRVNLSNAESKNTWIYTSTAPSFFMTWWLISTCTTLPVHL